MYFCACRCVVCRDGQAVEMSVDHKPEDQVELNRIRKAGGKVTPDGRVNGGLNLSRALGDLEAYNPYCTVYTTCLIGHSTKQNQSLFYRLTGSYRKLKKYVEQERKEF